MTNWGKPKECSECRAALTHPKTGRPRATCSAACADTRHRRMKRFKKHAVAENLGKAEKAYLEEFRREMIAPLQKREGPP